MAIDEILERDWTTAMFTKYCQFWQVTELISSYISGGPAVRCKNAASKAHQIPEKRRMW